MHNRGLWVAAPLPIEEDKGSVPEGWLLVVRAHHVRHCAQIRNLGRQKRFPLTEVIWNTIVGTARGRPGLMIAPFEEDGNMIKKQRLRVLRKVHLSAAFSKATR